MRTRKQHLEFANFHLRSGAYELVDLLNDIVAPSLFDSRGVKVGTTKYLALEAQLIDVAGDGEDPDWSLAFEFAKDITLTREQILSGANKLVRNRKQMKSAPSAHVLLSLNDHRLVYLPKTAYAPTMKQLETALRYKFERQRAVVIATALKTRLGSSTRGAAALRRELEQQWPPITLHVVPFSDANGIAQALSNISRVQRVRVDLVPTNAQLDGAEFYQALREKQERLKAKTASVQHETSSKDGLDKSAVAAEIEEAGKLATARVEIKGKTASGDDVRATSNELAIRVPTTIQVDKPSKAAKPMRDALKKLIAQGVVATPALLKDAKSKVTETVARLLQKPK